MKKMFDEVLKKKWLLLILAAVLVVALVVGIVAIAGGGEKDPNPTKGTSNVGDPTETTGGNGNEVTDPSDNTEPTDDPDAPIGDYDPDAPPTPLDPDAPPVVDPDPTPSDPDDEPDDEDEGDEIIPTVPEDEPIETRPPDTGYDFSGVTPGNLTAADWKSWDADQRQAFYDTYDIANLSLDDKYNFYLQTQFNGYDCGFEGHHCAAQEHHDQVMAEMAAGCPHCGSNDCEAFYARNMMGFTQIDFSMCPMYDITKDPVYYCQVCGLPYNGESGETVCNKYVVDTTCDYCGEPVKADECHKCIKP